MPKLLLFFFFGGGFGEVVLRHYGLLVDFLLVNWLCLLLWRDSLRGKKYCLVLGNIRSYHDRISTPEKGISRDNLTYVLVAISAAIRYHQYPCSVFLGE